MKVPVIGESINEVTLSQWLKPDGSYVKLDEPICEFESDKATLEFPAEAEGKLIHVAKEGDDLAIGALVARIDTAASANGNETSSQPVKEKEVKEDVVAKKPAAEKKETVNKKTDIPEEKPENSIERPEEMSSHPSPAAAKILREGEVETKKVSGTGKEGRITKEDALKAVENKNKGDGSTPLTTSGVPLCKSAPIYLK